MSPRSGRLAGLLSALLALVLAFAPAWLLLRQPPPARASAPEAAPGLAASEERMALYQRLAAVNYCVARAAGLDDARAVPLAAQTIAVILSNEHGGRIARAGRDPLSPEALLRGSAELTLLGARGLCPQSVPEAVAMKLDEQEELRARETLPSTP